MLDPSGLQRGKMNTELITGETQPYLLPGERKALRDAERAEEAFRASKGYEPKGFWKRLKRRLWKK